MPQLSLLTTKWFSQAPRPRQGGFTLVEVLVSVLIFAIGLLGLAALQFTSLRSSHDAYLRSQVTQLSYDIADRMRLNQPGLASYLGSATNDDCVTNVCNSAQMAGYDLAKWNAALSAQLPSGTGTITLTGLIYSISISWTEHEESGIATKTFVTSFQP